MTEITIYDLSRVVAAMPRRTARERWHYAPALIRVAIARVCRGERPRLIDLFR